MPLVITLRRSGHVGVSYLPMYLVQATSHKRKMQTHHATNAFHASSGTYSISECSMSVDTIFPRESTKCELSIGTRSFSCTGPSLSSSPEHAFSQRLYHLHYTKYHVSPSFNGVSHSRRMYSSFSASEDAAEGVVATTPPSATAIAGASTFNAVASPLASPCSAMYASISAAALVASLIVRADKSLERGVS